MLFLRRLARYLDQDLAADEALVLLIRGVVLWALPPLLVGAFVGLNDMVGGVGLVGVEGVYFVLAVATMAVLVFVWLVWFIKFLFQEAALIGTLREVIRKQA